MKAKLVLEDGTMWTGKSFGICGERTGEAVFNTSITGYQEILTDPSYKGQIVIMTYPLIGNYGINLEDVESRKPFVEGFIVKECSRIASNWRSQKGLSEYLKENNILGIEGIDTRALTRHIRFKGAMKAVISTEDLDDKNLIAKAKSSLGLVGRDLVKEVSCDQAYAWTKTENREQKTEDRKFQSATRNPQPVSRFKIVVLDCGVKLNILRELSDLGCEVNVVSAKTIADEILEMKPDGLLLSNGPGDPAGVPYIIQTIKKLINPFLASRNPQPASRNPLPIMGICFGHQILGLALGGKTYKLKFGHHGGNHPVKDLKTGRVAITAQNHCFCLDVEKSPVTSHQSPDRYCMLGNEDVEITHINLNDGTCEGMRHKKLPIFSVQFHPESSPGPHDAQYLFKNFVELMEQNRAKTH